MTFRRIFGSNSPYFATKEDIRYNSAIVEGKIDYLLTRYQMVGYLFLSDVDEEFGFGINSIQSRTHGWYQPHGLQICSTVLENGEFEIILENVENIMDHFQEDEGIVE